MFLVRAGSSSRQAILLPRVAGVGAKISRDDVNRMLDAHLIFTSIRRNSFGRWLVVLAHTLPDRRNKNHVCCQLLRMEPRWRYYLVNVAAVKIPPHIFTHRLVVPNELLQTLLHMCSVFD